MSPTKNQDPFITLDLLSSELVMILNPIPLVSALQSLIDIPQIPFGPSKEENVDDLQKGNSILSTDIHVRVEKTSLLLMCDRSDILGGYSSCLLMNSKSSFSQSACQEKQ